MKYYSEDLVRRMVAPDWLTKMASNHSEEIINIRRCRDCEYFIRDHPAINTDGDFGYCEYRTDFCVLDSEPINWYFTDINGFCREDDIK